MPGHQAAFLGKPVSCRPLPPLHGKIQADWCPSGLQADVCCTPHMLALCSPTANAAWFVLGPGLEENHPSPPKKAVFKKYLENVHSLSGVGVRCLLVRLALQLRTLWSSSKEAGKECETLPLKEQKGFFFVCLFSVAFFFPFLLFASSYRVRLVEPAGSLSLLEEAPSQACGAAVSKSKHLAGYPRCSPRASQLSPPSPPSFSHSPSLPFLSPPLGSVIHSFNI